MDLLFFFDFSSPFAYLGATQVAGIAQRTGARLLYRPFLLGGLFRELGTPDVPFFHMPLPKQRHTAADMGRWADHWNVPFVFPSRFPMNSVKALRMVLAVEEPYRGRLVDVLFHAAWAQDEDITADATLARVAGAAGYDGWGLVRETRETRMKNALKNATDRAQSMGVCGAPTFVVKDPLRPQEPLLFWGQDRLALVEKALGGWPGGALDGPDAEAARHVEAAMREEELTGARVFQGGVSDESTRAPSRRFSEESTRAPSRSFADDPTRLPSSRTGVSAGASYPLAGLPTAVADADDAPTGVGHEEDDGTTRWAQLSSGEADVEAGDLDGPTISRNSDRGGAPSGVEPVDEAPRTRRRRP